MSNHVLPTPKVTNWPYRSLHRAPFLQGCKAHSSISIWHKRPVKPGAQKHSNLMRKQIQEIGSRLASPMEYTHRCLRTVESRRRRLWLLNFNDNKHLGSRQQYIDSAWSAHTAFFLCISNYRKYSPIDHIVTCSPILTRGWKAFVEVHFTVFPRKTRQTEALIRVITILTQCSIQT